MKDNLGSKNYIMLLIVFILVAIDITLSLLHIIPVKSLVWVAAVIEISVILIVLFQLSKVILSYRTLRNAGCQGIEAFQKALEVVLPPVVARLSTIELKLYFSLYRSLKSDPTEAMVFPSRLGTYSFFIKAMLFVAVLESLAIQFALSDCWWKLKVVHLILVVWAGIFIFSLYRAMKVFSHEIKPTGLLIQMGLSCKKEISWDQIVEINRCSKVVPAFKLGPVVPEEEPGVLYLAAGENCNVLIELKLPTDFPGMIRNFLGISKVFFSLEQPEVFVEEVRKRIAGKEG